MSSRNKARVKQYNERYAAELKAQVCTHYGPNGALQCSWPGCDVVDLDVLTIDHIKNIGMEAKKTSFEAGYNFYLRLRREGFPEGYQTLCHNHNWKKEIVRRRTEGRNGNYNV